MKSNNQKKLIIIRSNNPDFETRMQNILASAQSFSPILIYWDRSGKKEVKKNSFCYSKPSPFGLSVIRLIPGWWYFIFSILLKEKPQVIHACNIDSAIPGYIYCLCTKSHLIYDIWDTASGMYGRRNKIISILTNSIEKHIISRCSLLLLPDKERLTQLQYSKKQQDKLKWLYIPNSIYFTNNIKKIIKPKKQLRILYIGILSTKNRGLEYALLAIKAFPNIILTIGGYGANENDIKAIISRTNLTNVHFIGPVKREDIKKLMNNTDYVLTLLDPKFTNYQYATSTKVFEAFAYGKPVITTKGTASGNIVEKANWGYAIPYTLEDLEKIFHIITDIKSKPLTLDPELIKIYDWRRIEPNLINAYEKLLAS